MGVLVPSSARVTSSRSVWVCIVHIHIHIHLPFSHLFSCVIRSSRPNHRQNAACPHRGVIHYRSHVRTDIASRSMWIPVRKRQERRMSFLHGTDSESRDVRERPAI